MNARPVPPPPSSPVRAAVPRRRAPTPRVRVAHRPRLCEDARPHVPRPMLATIDVPLAARFASDRWIRSAGPLAGAGAARTIEVAVASLASWAMTGSIPIDDAEELLLQVVRWLHIAPLDDTDALSIPIAIPDWTDAPGHLAVLILAARGRIRLARADVITAAELAALSGYSINAIGRAATAGAEPIGWRAPSEASPQGEDGVRLIRAGESNGKRFPAPITGESARALLVMTGVPGFAPAGKRRAR